MTKYSVGAKMSCDFHFGGKPRGVVVEVVKPGTGKDSSGLVKVKLTETVGAYKKGEVLLISTYYAVPLKQELRKRGSFFTWVNTDYEFVPPNSVTQ